MIVVSSALFRRTASDEPRWPAVAGYTIPHPRGDGAGRGGDASRTAARCDSAAALRAELGHGQGRGCKGKICGSGDGVCGDDVIMPLRWEQSFN